MALDELTQQLLVNQPQRKPQNRLDKFLSTPGGSFLMNILAQSGYSTMPQSPFGAIGKAALMTQQQQRQQGLDDMQRRLIESQIGLNERRSSSAFATDVFGRLNVSDFTPESVSKFQESGDYGDLVIRDRQIGDPKAVAEFKYFQTLSPEEQERYLRVKRSPYIANIPGAGVVEAGQLDPTETTTIVPETTVTEGEEGRSRARGKGTETGKQQGAQAAKSPVMASYKVAGDLVRQRIADTPQGGALGLTGRGAAITDYQAVNAFNNAVQQLSTELRTVFRIPGEGTLSDREQEQYNLQLPNVLYDREINEQIMDSLDARIAARVQTQIGDGQPASNLDKAREIANRVNRNGT